MEKTTDESRKASRKVLILIKEHKIAEAKELCKEHPDNVNLQLDLMIILFMEAKGLKGVLRENKLKEARQIGARFPDDDNIQNQLKEIDDFEKNSVPKTKKKKIYIVKNKDQMTQGD